MIAREGLPEVNRTMERFSAGRPDKLREHEYFRKSSIDPNEYISRFYSESRLVKIFIIHLARYPL